MEVLSAQTKPSLLKWAGLSGLSWALLKASSHVIFGSFITYLLQKLKIAPKCSNQNKSSWTDSSEPLGNGSARACCQRPRLCSIVLKWGGSHWQSPSRTFHPTLCSQRQPSMQHMTINNNTPTCTNILHVHSFCLTLTATLHCNGVTLRPIGI